MSPGPLPVDQAEVAVVIALNKHQTKTIVDNFLLPPPFDDPLSKWNLWNDLDSVKAIIVGILHARSRLDFNRIGGILQARNRTAYGQMTSTDVEFIFSWLRNNPDAPNNPYKLVFDELDKEDGSKGGSNVFACMRASVLLGQLESEADIPRAKEEAHLRMDVLKAVAKSLKRWDARIKKRDAKIRREQRKAEQAKESAEKSEKLEAQRVSRDEEREGGAGAEEKCEEESVVTGRSSGLLSRDDSADAIKGSLHAGPVC